MSRLRRPKRIVKTATSLKTSQGEIPFVLSRSTGRRTLSISVDEHARVSVFSPFAMDQKEIHGFIHQKAQWIFKRVQEANRNREILSQKDFADGHRFLFLGKKYDLHVVSSDVKRSCLAFDEHNGWTVVVPRGLSTDRQRQDVKRKMLRWYRAQAEEVLGGRIFHYGRILDILPQKIAVRSQKRLWGCCDYNTQTVHLNWQIILSPLKVVDYVVVHELCHLLVPSHSKRFWNKVAKVMPDYDDYRRWLKVNHLEMLLP